jgi:endonuclease/exonuclease/phosphatase family metal-dependent hydrolase
VKKVLFSIAKEHIGMCANPIVVAGDFNIDGLSSNTDYRYIVRFMSENLNLAYLHTGSTSDYGSALDHIYTNFAQSDIQGWGTLESYYSDHKPLYLILK